MISTEVIFTLLPKLKSRKCQQDSENRRQEKKSGVQKEHTDIKFKGSNIMCALRRVLAKGTPILRSRLDETPKKLFGTTPNVNHTERMRSKKSLGFHHLRDSIHGAVIQAELKIRFNPKDQIY